MNLDFREEENEEKEEEKEEEEGNNKHKSLPSNGAKKKRKQELKYFSFSRLMVRIHKRNVLLASEGKRDSLLFSS